MNNRMGLALLGLLAAILLIFGIVQSQNLSQSQTTVSVVQKTVTAQAKAFADQGTSAASTLMAAGTQAAQSQNQAADQASTAQADAVSKAQTQAAVDDRAHSTATLGAAMVEAATAQANALGDVQIKEAVSRAIFKSTITALDAQLASANDRLATANAQLGTAQVTPTATVQQPTPQNSDLQLGAPVSAVGVDNNGCATTAQDTFAPDQSIYVVAPNSKIPKGTVIFVRLYRDNIPIEDAPEITADRDYDAVCINYVFQPTGANFMVGTYKAQFFVNGSPGATIIMSVQ